MPLGVDHVRHADHVARSFYVILPLMPLGVDHSPVVGQNAKGDGDFTFDAVRR